MVDEPHPEVQTVLRMIEDADRPDVHELPVERAREQFRALASPGKPEVASVTDRTLPGPAGEIPVRVYTPDGEGPHPALVYLHGGGFVLGDLDTHDRLCRALCTESSFLVVAVDYRLAPEHPFPAPLHDAYAAVEWVAENATEVDGDPDRMAVGGDSAGANLAAGVTLLSRDTDGPDIAHQVLVYPTVASGAVHEFDSYAENGEGYFLEAETMAWFDEKYVRDPVHRRNEYSSPLLVDDYAGLPPASVVTAGFDPLRDEGVAYAEALAADGVPVEHHHYEEMIHGFVGMLRYVSRAEEAVEALGADLRDVAGSA